MTLTTVEHCCGARFRASKPLLGEANMAWVLSQSAAAMARVVRMNMGGFSSQDVLYCTDDEVEGKSSVIRKDW